MVNLKFLILLSLALPVFARMPLEDKMHELSIYLEEAQFQLNHHKVEIDLFHERLATMESLIQKKIDELSSMPKATLDTSKLTLLEEKQKALTTDLGKLAKQQVELLANQTKLEAQMNEKLSKVNKSIAQLLSLLDTPQKSQSYTVQPGDSLSKIAEELHISVEELKKLNLLSKDNIYVGQKLRLP